MTTDKRLARLDADIKAAKELADTMLGYYEATGSDYWRLRWEWWKTELARLEGIRERAVRS